MTTLALDTSSLFLIAFVLVNGVVFLALGVGVWFLLRSSRRTHPSCPGCGYDVSETIGHSTTCPECGVDLRKVGVRPPR